MDSCRASCGVFSVPYSFSNSINTAIIPIQASRTDPEDPVCAAYRKVVCDSHMCTKCVENGDEEY